MCGQFYSELYKDAETILNPSISLFNRTFKVKVEGPILRQKEDFILKVFTVQKEARMFQEYSCGWYNSYAFFIF